MKEILTIILLMLGLSFGFTVFAIYCVNLAQQIFGWLNLLSLIDGQYF